MRSHFYLHQLISPLREPHVEGSSCRNGCTRDRRLLAGLCAAARAARRVRALAAEYGGHARIRGRETRGLACRPRTDPRPGEELAGLRAGLARDGEAAPRPRRRRREFAPRQTAA